MPRHSTTCEAWSRCSRSVAVAILIALCVGQFCNAGEPTHKWSVVMFREGRETASIPVPLSSPLHSEVEATQKTCIEKSRMDLATYAPSLRIETDLERIDLRGKSVVYSSRTSREGAWRQRSRRSDEGDHLLRQKVLLFVDQATRATESPRS